MVSSGWERLYLRKVSLRKGHWIRGGFESIKFLKSLKCQLFLALTSAIFLVIIKLGWFHPQSTPVIFTSTTLTFIVISITAFLSLNRSSLVPVVLFPLQSPWVTNQLSSRQTILLLRTCNGSLLFALLRTKSWKKKKRTKSYSIQDLPPYSPNPPF